jgi:glycosyltransferase involved in cell wall biosynthesis
MNSNSARDLTSVVIPCWNQVEFSKLCIRSLLSHTRRPWELIVINNGSTDGTADYLAGIQDGGAVPVTIIANETNRGFPAAVNQGLQAARGEYLVLLNNDVVVTHDWLEQMIALANARSPAQDLDAGLARIQKEWTGAELSVIDFNELDVGGREPGLIPLPPCACTDRGLR